MESPAGIARYQDPLAILYLVSHVVESRRDSVHGLPYAKQGMVYYLLLTEGGYFDTSLQDHRKALLNPEVAYIDQEMSTLPRLMTC